MSIIEENSVKLVSDSPVAEILINRAQSLNALNTDVLQGLVLTFDKLSRDSALRAVIITGAGEKAFVAGADIPSMAVLGPRAIADYVELGQRAMRRIETCPVPVIAAVNGFALGGGLELALACDIIFASKKAKVGQPEVNLGIIPGFGGTQRLALRAGVGTTRRLVFSGELIDAEEAKLCGIVDKLCEPENLMEEVRNYAALIAAKGPLAVRKAKEVIRRTEEIALLGGLRNEIEAFLELFASADREEGMNAFLEKRQAKFRGV